MLHSLISIFIVHLCLQIYAVSITIRIVVCTCTSYLENIALLAVLTNNYLTSTFFVVTAWFYASCADMEV